LSGVINYEIDKLFYSSAAPANFIDYTIFQAMLPFMAFAVLSFVVLAFSLRAAKPAAEKETEMQEIETEPKQEEHVEEAPT